jgi:hypothetical protein
MQGNQQRLCRAIRESVQGNLEKLIIMMGEKTVTERNWKSFTIFQQNSIEIWKGFLFFFLFSFKNSEAFSFLLSPSLKSAGSSAPHDLHEFHDQADHGNH